LVFIILLLFLRPALAVWVAVGIAVSFIGSLLMLPLAGTSINIMTLFAFIMVLGIVVDDAIIVGESIYTQHQKGIYGKQGSKIGVNLVAKPVFFAVTTSILVFIPLLMLSGQWAYFMGPIATIPILVLLFSLLESCLILPAHLADLKPEREKPWFPQFRRLRHTIDRGLRKFLILYYQPFLRKCLRNRGVVVGCFIGFCAISVSLVSGNRVKVSLPPDVSFDFIQVDIDFPEGVAHSVIQETAKKLEDGAAKTSETLTLEGEKPVLDSIFIYGGTNRIFTLVELTPETERQADTLDFSRLFQENLGPLIQAEKIKVIDKVAFESADLTLRLYATDSDKLDVAADWFEQELLKIEGFHSVSDNILAGRLEMNLLATQQAANLGLSISDIARQVRQYFYGEEAQRVPRGKEDVRVMVRYPQSQREDINTLQELRIRTQNNQQIPLDVVSDIEFQEGFSKIIRVDGRISMDVNADYDNENSSLNQAVLAVKNDLVPRFEQKFPDVTVDMKGEQEEVGSFVNDLIRFGFMAILVIYGLLSIQFRSIYQPLIIISAIPISLTGVIWPHLFSGSNISLMSVMGMLAAAGVIVNDTIVLLDGINRKRRLGMALDLSLLIAAKSRFRPIFLTTLTTFFGLVPIMLETSVQAKFLIPMAMALAYGILSASIVTLILVPVLFSLGYQFKNGLIPFYQKHLQLGLQGTQRLWVVLFGYGILSLVSAAVAAVAIFIICKIVLSFIGLHPVHVSYFTSALQYLIASFVFCFWLVSMWRCSHNVNIATSMFSLVFKCLPVLLSAVLIIGFLQTIGLIV